MKTLPKRILELEEATKNNGGLNFQIAINYGSRDEMIRAIRKIAKDCVDGKVDPAEIKEETFEQYLDTKGIPDPDLMIRTSGELQAFQLSVMAACLYRILFYRCSVAGFQ